MLRLNTIEALHSLCKENNKKYACIATIDGDSDFFLADSAKKIVEEIRNTLDSMQWEEYSSSDDEDGSFESHEDHIFIDFHVSHGSHCDSITFKIVNTSLNYSSERWITALQKHCLLGEDGKVHILPMSIDE